MHVLIGLVVLGQQEGGRAGNLGQAIHLHEAAAEQAAAERAEAERRNAERSAEAQRVQAQSDAARVELARLFIAQFEPILRTGLKILQRQIEKQDRDAEAAAGTGKARSSGKG